MTRGEITGLEGSERRELAPLTDAQRLTVDALALFVAARARTVVSVAITRADVPAPDAGAVLVLVTPDAGGARDRVTAVYGADGARTSVLTEQGYAEALTAVGGARSAAVVREGTAAYRIYCGGTFEQVRA